MKKILFIGKNYKNGLVNGGNEVTKRNVEILKELYEVDEVLLEFKVSYLKKLWYILTCNTLNFNRNIKNNLKKKIKVNTYEYVWIDTSIYGSIAKYIKNENPKIKIITFFHNIEYSYFKEKIKVEGIKNLIMLPYIYVNERRIINNSDKLIVLNRRDSEKLKKEYREEAELIIPLTLKDKFEGIRNKNIETNIKRGLFVGSNFFANVQGIKWFVENVLPEVEMELIIVGSGMDLLKEELENKNLKVKVLGFVKDVGPEYQKADFVIAPIFFGSGMKTKTTEALMYGKTIFGTQEAFEGFNLNFERVGGLCNTKEEFIKKINENIKNKINNYSRETYLKLYSNERVKKIIKEIKWKSIEE